MVRVRFLVTVLVLLVAVSSFGATRPPRELRLVGDHWTAYDPPDPATFPPGSKVHIIERGDTLWALAQRFYGDPYLWPQLWEHNTYITDAHWIYPGDPLLIEGEATTGEVVTETAVGVQEGEEEPVVTAGLEIGTPPVPLGHESDIYCYGYLGGVNEYLPNRIASFEDYEVKWMPRATTQENGVVQPDVVYINLDDPSLVMAGETYLVVKPAEIVRNPETDEVIGRHYGYRGRVRILCINGTTATAMVVQACDAIRVGDAIKPMPQHPIPIARLTEMAGVCTPPNGRATGLIVNAKDYASAMGLGTMVEINLGRDQMVEPGTFLTVYRESPVGDHPRLILGELGVLTAEAGTATAQIVRMRYAMRVGDRIEIK
ncbi:MAG TPA: LysM peptidoglycan-binding domain-containing protein [Thermoanaerobaculia bacterium]|nr:LysM peptidoglycan-binding domain-containing protein [Thermoanaerobaculia bacterium]